jgi:hypothetical protein
MKSILVRLSVMLLMTMSCMIVFAQKKSDSKENKLPAIVESREIKENGWPTTWANCPVGHMIYEKERDINGMRILERHYNPQCSENGHKLDIKKETNYLVETVSEYSVNGKVFCYCISAAPYSSEFKESIGGLEDYCYYDDDGSSLFKTRETHRPFIFIDKNNLLDDGSKEYNPVRVPEWVKNYKPKSDQAAPGKGRKSTPKARR